jgi:hypothetical protein
MMILVCNCGSLELESGKGNETLYCKNCNKGKKLWEISFIELKGIENGNANKPFFDAIKGAVGKMFEKENSN